MENNIKHAIAEELAISFGVPIERAEMARNTSSDSNAYPRFLETIFPRTTQELAESETVVAFINQNGLLEDRPLTFVEIIARIEELGYEIKTRDIEK